MWYYGTNHLHHLLHLCFQAGIDTRQLTISLEPECASLFCQYLPVDRFCGGGEAHCRLTAPGIVYMIVDLGGRSMVTLLCLTCSIVK